MKEGHRRLKLKHCLLILVASGLLLWGTARLLAPHLTPIRINYDEEAREIVVTSGPLHTLEDYRITWVHRKGDEPLRRLSDPSDPEYRFYVVTGSGAIEKIRITAYSELLKERVSVELEVSRSTDQDFKEYCWFDFLPLSGSQWLKKDFQDPFWLHK